MNRGLWLLAVLLSAAGAAAEPRLILDAGVGAVYGETTELVLRDGTYQNPISRLVWPTPPSVAAEAGARIAWTDWTSTEARLRSAWQTRPGTIVDEDWNAGSLVYGRSEHSAYLTSLVEVEANQRLTWGPLDLLVGGRYRWASWEAWDGQGTYQYTAGTNKNSFRGAVLDYRQMWLLPYAGLGLTGKAFGVRWNPEIRLGPYTWCLDRDDHNYAAVKDGYEVSSLAFLDYPVGGAFAEARLEALFGSGWGLRWTGAGTWGAVGDTVITHTSEAANTPYGVAPAGAGAWYWETSLSAFVRN